MITFPKQIKSNKKCLFVCLLSNSVRCESFKIGYLRFCYIIGTTANDSSLSYPGSNSDVVKSQTSEDMRLMQEYFGANLLSLILSKTIFMILI